MAATPDVPLQSRIVDDKSPICIPFILKRIEVYRQQHPNTARPFIIGLNGIQGVGKTTLVRALAQTLERQGHKTLVVSIDDFYLTHADQLKLAGENPDNALVQCRGEPGTHDIPLLTSFIESLTSNNPSTPIHVPRYDKSAFSGLGDRLPASSWTLVQPPISVVILEGWLVGFRPLSPQDLEAKYISSEKLHVHKPEHLALINSSLAGYQPVWDSFDTFIYIDAADTRWVYEWRKQQERQLKHETGEGMTDAQVDRFVDAYYPAYELYLDGVRAGVFQGRKAGCQLRLVVDEQRRVIKQTEI